MQKNYLWRKGSKRRALLRRSSLFSLLFAFFALVAVPGCQLIDDFLGDPKDVGKPRLALIAEGLTSPVTMAEAPDGSGRLYIVDQTGVIRVVTPDGKLQEEPFLDIRDKVIELKEHYDERGLLGFAFHPNYAINRRFFVYYSAPLRPEAPDDFNHTSHISEFKAPAHTPLKADKTSERVIMYVDQPQSNHNAGTLVFGPADNYLYISLGDGGNRDDQGIGHVDDWYEKNVGGNGQDITQNLLGSILRIDVDGGMPYGIPADNPFVGKDGLDEIYAFGFRNPYRFSFDMAGNHTMYSQDAGQEMWEEVSIVTKGGNYGWNVKEGTHCFDAANPENPPADCPDTDAWGNPLIDPVIEFLNAHQPGGVGVVVVGGHVYRGDNLPLWKGKYIFGTWSAKHDRPEGKVFISQPKTGPGLWGFETVEFANTPSGELNHYVLGFGQDQKGEVYVLTRDRSGPTGNTGKVYKMY
jgi:glucose/arabinose dehydrogenase